MIAVGYVRVSTLEQAEHGYSLDAQEQAIREAATRKGWELAAIHRDEGRSASTLERPALTRALEHIAYEDPEALIVAKLDRLSRSLADFAQLLEWFQCAGAQLVALDMDVDTSTANGELMAHIFAAFAQWERRIIGMRTREGLAEFRRRGGSFGGISDDPVLAQQIRDLRDSGLSYREICLELERLGVPTVGGGRCWRKSSLQRFLGETSKVQRPRRRSELPEIIPRRKDFV